jgi:hypothetical protein
MSISDASKLSLTQEACCAEEEEEEPPLPDVAS